MSYLEDITKQLLLTKPVGTDLGLPRGGAYASYFPGYEVQTPQYIVPNAYSSANAGYRTNEFAYSLTTRRSEAIANAPLKLYDHTGETPVLVDESPLYNFLGSLNDLLTEQMFWGVTELTRCIGGFCAWNIERNGYREPAHLWYMAPHWCSFLRGPNKVFRAIRYQPYGMAPMDILAEDILLFYGQDNFDPLYPFLKWISPTMVCFPQLDVDTAMTHFLQDFIRHGARVNGILSVAQTVQQADAERIRALWIAQHGGSDNWSAPAVLGEGASFTPTQMNFNDMAFPALDARTETRMCDAFKVPTIVADASAGLSVSTYNNVVEAHKNWHYKWVVPNWRNYAQIFAMKMLPLFGIDPKKYKTAFDTSEIYELKEDKAKENSVWIGAMKQNAITRDEGRKKMGFDPIDNAPVFIGATVRENIAQTGGPNDIVGPETNKQTPDEITAGNEQAQTPKAVDAGKPATTPGAADEIKAFRKFAKTRIKEGKTSMLASFEFKYLDLDDQNKLLAEFREPAGLIDRLDTLAAAINAAAKG
jgi:HK97 family phage portal protein